MYPEEYICCPVCKNKITITSGIFENRYYVLTCNRCRYEMRFFETNPEDIINARKVKFYEEVRYRNKEI